MSRPSLTTQQIEYAVARHLSWRQNVIVPNVYWGFHLSHEADLLVITPARSCWEIEIKVSVKDLRRDRLKKHGHDCDRVRRLYFAIPKALEKEIPNIREDAGVFVVDAGDRVGGICRLVRAPKERRGSRALTPEEVLALMRLAAMRIWTLKEHLIRACGDRQQKRKETKCSIA